MLLRPGKLIYGRERSTALIRLDYQPLFGDMSLRPFPEPIVSSGRSEDWARERAAKIEPTAPRGSILHFIQLQDDPPQE